MPARIFVVRHGETDWSKSGQHTSRTDRPLTAVGEAEARALTPILAPLGITQVWTSPRERARRTCELAGLGAHAGVDPDLAEWDYGDFEGLRTPEILASHPGWRLFQDGCPGGESPQQVSARADRVVARLRALDGPVAVFTHGHMGRVLAVRWAGLAAAAGEHLLLGTACLGVLGFEHGHLSMPVIERWNVGSGPLA